MSLKCFERSKIIDSPLITYNLCINYHSYSFHYYCRISQFSKSHILQTFLFVVEFLIGYLLMLTVMTYNGWLFIAVIVGSATGYTACSYINLRHRFQITSSKTTRNQNNKRGNQKEDLEEDIEMLTKRIEAKPLAT